MLSKLPFEIEDSEDLDKQIARLGLMAELDAISLYEQLANKARNLLLKRVLLEIAKEEKTHVGEFLELLERLDAEQVEELERGRDEVEEKEG